MYQIVLHLSSILLLIALVVRFSRRAGEFKTLPILLIILFASWGIFYVPDVLLFFVSNPAEASGVVKTSVLTNYPYHLITNTMQTSNNNVFKVVLTTNTGEEIVLYEARTQYISYYKSQELLKDTWIEPFSKETITESPFKEGTKYTFKYYPQSKIIADFKEL